MQSTSSAAVTVSGFKGHQNKIALFIKYTLEREKAKQNPNPARVLDLPSTDHLSSESHICLPAQGIHIILLNTLEGLTDPPYVMFALERL